MATSGSYGAAGASSSGRRDNRQLGPHSSGPRSPPRTRARTDTDDDDPESGSYMTHPELEEYLGHDPLLSTLEE